MAERKPASRLSGVLERSTLPETEETEPTILEAADGESSRGRGVASKKPKAPNKRTGRTIYLDDTLFERIIVQAHRRNRTISEYVAAILERQVPDHRVVRADQSEAGAA